MKNTTTNFGRWLFLLICLCFLSNPTKAQTYTNTYNGINYSSSRPYNLNVIYFVPNDITLDTTYKARLSALMLWGQNFYKQNMIDNGYGSKTFGLFTETANPNNVKIILIQGAHPSSSYPYSNYSQLLTEVNAYFTNNPSQKTSEHTLIITATADLATADVPFYGIGKTCFALDYPQFDIQYLGTNTNSFTLWFGGMMHELGHGLNLPHSLQTNTENNAPNKGMNLMSLGNYTLGMSPTFINRAGTATLNNSQVFANTPGVRYNGHTATFNSIHTSFSNGNLTVSGTFESNRTVKDINIYQDPYETPSAGYYKTAWSVAPIGNTYSISMPVSELSTATNGSYNLQIELVLDNGEKEFAYFPFSYASGIPDINVNFDGVSACVGNALQFTTNIPGTAYRWQFLYNGSWNNYPEGSTLAATYTGTQTPNMTISNISSAYIATPNTVRVAITQADGSMKYSSVQTWRANNCTLATSEIKENKEQSVYPNPVKDELTINLGSVKDNYDIEIVNSLGQIVYKTTTSDQTLKVQLSDKPSGLYIVNIKGSKTGSNKSIKIIKK